MPIVNMPNGDHVQFPDSMPPEQIKALILSKFPDAGRSAAPTQAQAQQPSAAEPSLLDRAINAVPIVGPAFNLGRAAVDQLNQGGAPGPGEKRGNLLPVINGPNGMRPAWPQLALDAGNAFQLPGDVLSGKAQLDPRVGMAGQDPNTLDRAATLASMVGSELPMAERGMTPATAHSLVDSQGRRMPKVVANDLANSGIAPQDVNSAIAGVGEGGVLGDLSYALQGRTAKLATLPGKGASTVASAMEQRQADAAKRIPAELNNIAGPEPIPSAVTAAIDAKKAAISALYEPAFKVSKPVNVAPIVSNLDGNIKLMRGDAQKALERIRPMFNTYGDKTLSTDPRTLFEIRQAIDGQLEGEVNSKVIGVLSSVRAKVDSALAEAVPGIKKLDMHFQEQARQQEGFNMGRTAIRGGEAPMHPDDLAAAMQNAAVQTGSLIGPAPFRSAVPNQIQQGMLSKMYEIIGTNANDRISLKKILVGDGKWNYQKIASAFGQEKADQLLNLFQNEARKAHTENLTLHGAKTARMAAGGQGMEGNQNSSGFLKSAFNLDFGDAGLAAANKVLGGALTGLRNNRNAAIGDALMSQGGWRLSPQAASLLPRVVWRTNDAALERRLRTPLLPTP